MKRASGGQIPILDEFLGTIPAGKGAFLELKTGPEIVAPLAREIAIFDRPWDARLTLMSFFPATVRAARAAFPGSPVNWLVDLADIGDPVTIARSARELRVDGLGLSHSPRIDANFLRPLLHAALPVHLWTVDDPAEARRYAGLEITSLTTNRPGALRAALSEKPFSP